MSAPWKVLFQIKGFLSRSGPAEDDIKVSHAFQSGVPNGDSNAEADTMCTATFSISAGGTTDIDFTAFPRGGPTADVASDTFSFSQIVSIFFETPAENGGEITIEPHATNGLVEMFGDAAYGLALDGQSCAAFAKLVDVDASNKVLQLANAGGAARTVTVTVIGN